MIVGILLAALLQAAPYERAPLSAGDFIWLEQPTAKDIGRFYPNTTARAVERMVVIECGVGRSGRLDRCMVFKAPPTDNGETAATLRMASFFRMSARTKSGESTTGRKVHIPVLWKLPE